MFESIKKYFSGSQEALEEVVTSHDLSSNIKIFPTTNTTQWRPHMWVIVDGAVGILHRMVEDTVAEVHYVNTDTGDTILIKNEPILALRQVTYDEIPLVRRQDFTREAAERLGYGS